jgi:hypothetical protein
MSKLGEQCLECQDPTVLNELSITETLVERGEL